MTTEMASEQTLGAIARGEAPVLETLAQMHLDTLERSGLDERTYHLVRLASLIAIDAPPVSYLMNLSAATEAGVTTDDVRGMLTAVAPVVGSARVVSGAGNTLRALGIAEAINDTGDMG